MFDSLKHHHFPVDAFFDYSLVLTFAVPKAELVPLIPTSVDLDTYNDTLGFVAVAAVQTRALRPKGFPPFLGNDFFLIGYRIFVRFTTQQGKSLRGLYILRSETDKKRMAFLGSLFTHYNYAAVDITAQQTPLATSITSSAGLKIHIESPDAEIALPEHSPFPTWKDARRYAGPLPFTFTNLPDKKSVLIVEGVRDDWTPKPVLVKDCRIPFLDSLNLHQPVLANAFMIQNIPYSWKKGRLESWKG
jgi:hypothetical protein